MPSKDCQGHIAARFLELITLCQIIMPYAFTDCQWSINIMIGKPDQ